MQNKVSDNKASDPAGERIAKRMARVGLCSRRDAEKWIEEGRVKVNGRVLSSPAYNLRPSDRVEVDGVPLPTAEPTRAWLYHKPRGLVTSHSDPEGRPTVFESLSNDLPRVISVGRLDINTEGLLILTNDGGLARVLELPATGWMRRYRVRAYGELTEDNIRELARGITVDGVSYGPIEVKVDRSSKDNIWLTVGLREGKNREIKKVLGVFDLKVSRLIRVSYGPFMLGDLKEGEAKEVRPRILKDQLGERLIAEAGLHFPEGREAVEARIRGRDIAPKIAERPRPRRARAEGEDGRARYPADKNTPARREERPHAPRPRSERRPEDGTRPEDAEAPRPRGFKPRPRRSGEERQERGKPSFGKPRADRPREERTGEDRRPYQRSGGERRAGERPSRPGPAGDRPDGDRFRNDRPRNDRPRDERPRAEGPREDRPRSERPRGVKPFGKPGEEKPFGARPRSGKPFAGPKGDKPGGRGPGGAGPGKSGFRPGGNRRTPR